MILVTSAAGHLGPYLFAEILGRVPPYQVAASTRHPEKLGKLARKGVSVRKVEYADPRTLHDAFQGVEALLLLSTDADVACRTAQHESVIEVAKLRGVKRIVYTSFIDPDAASPFPFAAAHNATEAALRASGLDWTVLRVNGFAESLIEELNAAFESGVYQDPSPRGRVSYVGRADVARAAAAALIDRGHEGKTYEITGPAALSSRDVAAILSCIAGRRIETRTTPVRDFVAQLKDRGVRDYYAEAIGGLHVAIDEGRLQKVSNDVKKLTGQPANLVEEALRDALMERQRQAA